jgi:stearoyl-CoA desaturase (delta-9 desaturase)
MKFNLRLSNTKVNIAYYISAIGFTYAMFNWSWEWAIFSLIVHMIVVSLFSSVVHRYFCHRAYEANPTLMWLLSLIPMGYAYTSPILWASIHTAHHAFADTEKDTHVKGWRGFISSAYRMPPVKFIMYSKWFYDKKHEWIFNNSLLIILAFALVSLAISWQVFIWLYLVPLFTLHLFNGFHRTFSHGVLGRNGATRHWWLEYILPMGGEWIHDEHHQDARKAKFSNKWYEFDMGWMFVKLLSRPGTARTISLNESEAK